MGCGASKGPPGKSTPAEEVAKPPAEVPSLPPYNIDWTTIAPGHPDPPEHLGGDGDITAAVDKVMQSVFDAFSSPEFSGPLPPFNLLAPADADWSKCAPWVLSRVKYVNSLGGPRMRVVHFKTLQTLGSIPRWPEDSANILDLEDMITSWIERQDAKGNLLGRKLCVTMFSHRWSRPDRDPMLAHPDTTDGLKARSLAEYGIGGNCGVFPDHSFDYFFWIDYSGVNQTDRLAKTLGVAALPLYVATCIEIVFFYNEAYESRAWTRLERIIGYTFSAAPSFVLIDDKYVNKEMPSREALCDKAPSCFSLDDKTGGLLMGIHDPLGEDAGLTDPSDRALVERLLELCMKTPPLNGAIKESYGSAQTGLDLANLKFAVDIEHYRIDCQQARAVLEKRVMG